MRGCTVLGTNRNCAMRWLTAIMLRMKSSVVSSCLRLQRFRITGAVLAIAVALAGSLSSQSAPQTTPKKDLRLLTAVKKVVEQGHDATLPPHISNLLGISPNETAIPVKQLVTMGELIRGFDVSQVQRDDIVIFVEDHAKNESTFYLTSPTSRLRKLLSVRGGVGYDRKPTAGDREAFAKEKTYWLDQLVPAKRPAR
jgi:hypothetical protein